MIKDNHTNDWHDVIEAEKDYIFQDKSGTAIKFGLAISGGGVRSASFALGLLQALIKHKLLERVDYISTVSGGGYIGSALTWWRTGRLSEQKTAETTSPGLLCSFMTDEDSGSDTRNGFLNYLRTHSNYLLPTPALDTFSGAATIIRNSLVSALVYFGLMMLSITILHLVLGVIRLVFLPHYQKLILILFSHRLFIDISGYWRLIMLTVLPLMTSGIYFLVRLKVPRRIERTWIGWAIVWRISFLCALIVGCYFNWINFNVYFGFATNHVVSLTSALLLSLGVVYSIYFWVPRKCTLVCKVGASVVLVSYLFCLIRLWIDSILASRAWGLLLGEATVDANAYFALIAATIFIVATGLFFALCVVYSISTIILLQSGRRRSRGMSDEREGADAFKDDERRYDIRRESQAHFGWVLRAIVGTFFSGMVPAILVRVGSGGVAVATIFFVLLTSLILVAIGERLLRTGTEKSNLTLISGSFIFLFGFATLAFYAATTVVEPFVYAIDVSVKFRIESPEFFAKELPALITQIPIPSPPEYPVGDMVSLGTLTVIVSVYCLVVGFFVSVNYAGIHRIYRDRLMELFLPNRKAVQDQRWYPATEADSVLIEQVCKQPNVRPYHLLNANVVLVDSSNEKYRERGGANFIMSPLFCGSDATGWRRSFDYMRGGDTGLRLATAMAISAAAASPHAGPRRSAGTRSRMVSLAMSILNLRLGYWAPHPKPNPKRAKKEIPNFFFPGVVPALNRGFLSEDRRFLDLTDGGHFENLGLYELVRRRLKLIVVCDCSRDPSFEYTDLATAMERIRVDFGVQISFRDDRSLDGIEPGDGDASRSNKGFSQRGFAVADIMYSKRDGDSAGYGTLVYIKPTILQGLSPEIVSYRRRNNDFPNEGTANQFFHEAQFEAYRELGFTIGESAIEDQIGAFRSL